MEQTISRSNGFSASAMPLPFPATKFTVPRPAATGVLRERACRLLPRGDLRPVTIVRGLPGSGRSQLLADWLAAYRARSEPTVEVAWISCDDRDSDPSVLWSALLTALNRSIDGFAATSSIDPVAPSLPHGAAVINRLLERTTPLIIVFDDAHRAGDAMATCDPLLERLPPNVHVMFTTTARLPLSVGNLRLRHLLHEIQPHDLALDVDETRALLTHYGVELPTATVEALTERTEGWLGAIMLAIATSHDAPSRRRELERLAHDDGRQAWFQPALSQYFRENVLGRLPEQLRNFIVDVGFLGEFTPADCRAVVDVTDGYALLTQADAMGLFVVGPDENGSYRFHSLFADFLARESIGRDPDHDVALHRRAASWYASIGRTHDVIRHHVAAGDINEALTEGYTQMWGPEHANGCREIGTWLEELDADLVYHAESAEAFALYSLALITNGDLMNGRRFLLGAVNTPHEQTPRAQEMTLVAQIVLAHIEGDPLAGRQHLHELRVLREANGSEPTAIEPVARIAFNTWMGDFAESRTEYHEQVIRSRHPSSHDVFLTSAFACTAAKAGDLAEADELAGWSFAAADRVGICNPLPIVWAGQALGIVHYERGDFDAARNALTSALAKGQHLQSTAFELRILLARIDLAEGNVDDARAALGPIMDLLPRDAGAPLRDHAVVLDARIALALGEHGRARNLAEHIRTPWRALALQARVALAAGETHDAIAMLEKLERADSTRSRIDIAVLKARAALKAHDSPSALQSLRDAVELALPQNMVRPFFEDGLALWPTLRKVLSSSPHHEFHDRAHAMALHGRSIKAAVRPSDTSPLAMLRPREREVLRLIGQRMSNREIAALLYITPMTVKSHTRSLYKKLTINSRAEAIALSEDLGLG